MKGILMLFKPDTKPLEEQKEYKVKAPWDSLEVKKEKPVCADFSSFLAGFRCAERVYNPNKLNELLDHYIDAWSDMCNENQALLNRIKVLEDSVSKRTD
jgi:hypothetical protein